MGIEDFLSSGNIRLDQQLKFTAEIDKMTSVYRRTMLISGERHENDAEHSWHIAVMALLFKEYCVEEPSVERAIKMCVVHDLIEIYAGDTFAYDVKGNESLSWHIKCIEHFCYTFEWLVIHNTIVCNII